MWQLFFSSYDGSWVCIYLCLKLYTNETKGKGMYVWSGMGHDPKVGHKALESGPQEDQVKEKK